MKPEVTVYCLTYNHRPYIDKTLDGFVKQKTDFPFKVIVHDDASDDGTQDIIKTYARKYPNIFIPIYQKDNQYSKHVNIYDKFLRSKIESKYTAICEGDDYWCDENKLQLQYDYMEDHPSCSLCVHNTEMIDEQGKSMKKYFNTSSKNIDYNAEDVIERGPGGLFHTSSFLYRTSIRDERPSAFRMKYVGDYPLAIYLSCNGYVHYIGRSMSKYRVGSISSWVKANSSNKASKIIHLEDMIDSLSRMDSFTKGIYHLQFDKVIERTKFEKSLCKSGFFRTIQSVNYRKTFLTFSIKKQFKMILESLKR